MTTAPAEPTMDLDSLLLIATDIEIPCDMGRRFGVRDGEPECPRAAVWSANVHSCGESPPHILICDEHRIGIEHVGKQVDDAKGPCFCVWCHMPIHSSTDVIWNVKKI